MNATNENVQTDQLRNLLEHCLRFSYRAKDGDSQGEAILETCIWLFGKDYKYTLIDNKNGELCSHYPSKIIVQEYLATDSSRNVDNVESLYDIDRLKEQFNKARFARCRARFVIPVILYEGKHICRGATISGGAEIYGRSGFDFFMTGGGSIPDEESNPKATTPASVPTTPTTFPMATIPASTTPTATSTCGSGSSSSGSSEWQLFNRIRGQDIRLLKTFSVRYICDLMVEKKKVKFGMNVTSSEKVDKENRYCDFSIMSVPYPGCEFFRGWKQNGYMAEGMVFDWAQGYVDARLDFGGLSPPPDIDWVHYQKWDLIQLTQNYLKLLLNVVKHGDGGLLVHCISGWDRTPLFVALLRLSMWADGAIHPSLSPSEILFLCIGYDWFLFGHNLPDRFVKGEEIFFFCFNFLKYITSDDFNINKRCRSRTISRTDSDVVDGVLLDPELQRASYRGSNTSINSTSSLNSTRSSVDTAPIVFTAGSMEEDTFPPNGIPVTLPSHTTVHHRVSPVSRLSSVGQSDLPNGTTRTGSGGTSTSPMAVPSRITDMRNCSHFGSWQIISGCGSYRGSTSSQGSPHSSMSDPSSGQHCPQCDGQELPELSRKQRLDAVRRLFLNTYTSIVSTHPSPDGSAATNTGISGLLENFAEKVGFRTTSRNTYV